MSDNNAGEPSSAPKKESGVSTCTATAATRRRSLWVWGITGALILLLVAISVYLKLQKPPELVKAPPRLADVEIITLKLDSYQESLTLPARIMADQEYAVSFEFGGTLKKWLVGESEAVTRGQPLAVLDTDALAAELENLQAQKQAVLAGIEAATASRDLATVAKDRAGNQLTSARLQLQSAESARDLADKEFIRSHALAEAKILSVSELDTARDRLTQAGLTVSAAQETVAMAQSGIRSAELQSLQASANLNLQNAQLAQIQAGIKALRIRMNKAQVIASLDGVLDEHLVKAGEVLAPGQPIARIYDLDYVRARINVADRYIPFLTEQEGALKQFLEYSLPGAQQKISAQLIIPGMPQLDGGRGPSISLAADIARIAQAADPRSNTFIVDLRLKNPDGALKQGIIARAKIDFLFYPEALIIPMTAIQVTDSGPRCLVIEEHQGKSLARVRRITPRAIHKDRVLVQGELQAGDRLIIGGAKGVIDGEELRILKKDGVFLDMYGDDALNE